MTKAKLLAKLASAKKPILSPVQAKSKARMDKISAVTAKRAGKTVTVKAAKPKLTHDPKKDGIPAFLQTQNRKPLTRAQQAAVDRVTKAQRRDAVAQAVKEVAKGPAMAPGAAAEKLLALLAGKAEASRRPSKASGKVVPLPTGRAAIAPRQAPLAAAAVRPGLKVRIMGWKKPDVLSTEVFTIQKLDKGEKTLGPDWFAVDDRTQVHVDWLVAA